MNLQFHNWLFVLCVYLHVCHGQNVGEPCVQRRTQKVGVCQLLNQCPIALAGLNVGIRPMRCGFVGEEPVVCCIEGEDKIKKKCHEYGKLVTENVKRSDGHVSKISTCGVSQNMGLQNNMNAIPREFPHQALLGYGFPQNKTWSCGGSLISENFILTTAQCSSTHNPPRYVLLGDLDLVKTDDDASPIEYEVENIIIHPEYKPPLKYHDIALLKLKQQVQFNKYIRPACLHATFDTDMKSTDSFLVSGWGPADNLSNKQSLPLQKTVLEEFSLEECKQIYQHIPKRFLNNGIDNQTQICVGKRTESVDYCPDGNPLQIYNKDEYCMYEIVGIASYSKACGVGGIPGLYTRVSNYIKWIQQNVWPD